MNLKDRSDRLVEIFSCRDSGDQTGSVGSGFLLGGGVILTASHVLFPKKWGDGQKYNLILSARPLFLSKTSDLIQVSLLWPDSLEQLLDNNIQDIALLKFPVERNPSLLKEKVYLGLGDITKYGTFLDLEAGGFPEFRRNQSNVREVAEINGRAGTFAGAKNGVYELVELTYDGKRSVNRDLNWQGMSGAAVFYNNRIIGVLIKREKAGARHDFDVVRIDDILKDKGFAKALTDAAEFNVNDDDERNQGAHFLPGLDLISQRYFDKLSVLQSDEVLRYFDGAQPTWRHALSPHIPKRHAVEDIINGIFNATLDTNSCIMQLITGAAGEGKSTVLLQAAVAFVQKGWEVLFRGRQGIGLDPASICRLNADSKWLIVADSADDLVDIIDECSRALYEEGRSNVVFLIACRDTDWRFSKAREKDWETRLKILPATTLRGLDEADAECIVNAWANFGAAGLRKLQNFTTRKEQIGNLIAAAAQEVGGRAEGSFYGGLLKTRFDEVSLRAHLREMMCVLQNVNLLNGATLLDALVYLSIAHAAGIPGLNVEVLANIVGAAPNWVRSKVIRPLGEEAAISETSQHVYTRHRRVATIIMLEAEEKFDMDLLELWKSLVEVTIKTQKHILAYDQSYTRTIHVGPRLPRELKVIPRRRCISIAEVVAKTSVNMLEDRLDCIVDLAAVYRISKKVDKAIGLFRDVFEKIDSGFLFVDYNSSIRGFWYEWGVCEGKKSLNGSTDACFQGISLSDRLLPAEIDLRRISISCAGLALAFSKDKSSSIGEKARSSAIYIGLLADPDDLYTQQHLSQHVQALVAISAYFPSNFMDAVDCLISGLHVAVDKIPDGRLKEWVTFSDFQFIRLIQVLERDSSRFKQMKSWHELSEFLYPSA